MNRFVASLLPILALLCVAGCGHQEPACGSALCLEGLIIDIVDGGGEPIETFSGELAYDGETVAFECGPDAEESGDRYVCLGDGSLQLVDYPEEVDVTVSTDSLETEETLQPDYEAEFEEGRCAPCNQANEEVILE